MATIAFWGDSLTEGVPGAAYIDILKMEMPQHSILNYGKGGDTVRSLYTRAARMQARSKESLQKGSLQADVVVLWVGVNDLLPDLARFYPPMKRLVGQPWARSDAEFVEYYRRLLELFRPHCRRLLAVSPLCIGEDLDNRWNRELKGQARLIEDVIGEVSSPDFEVEFLDIRAGFEKEFSKLGDRKAEIIAQFLPVSPVKAAIDVLVYRSPASADRRAELRGLFFTMDGVHLNSRGARIVAKMFKAAIERPAPTEQTQKTE